MHAMINYLTRNVDYLSWVKDQEHTLRFFIERNPTIIKFRYFLILVLIASKRYKEASQECQRILNIYPSHSIARSLDNIFRSDEPLDYSHDRTLEPKKKKVHKPWRCCGLKDHAGADPIWPFS
jgi:hypothetical protein